MKITGDMKIAEVMALNPELEPTFLEFGMHCLYCPVASQETLEEAAVVHGISVDELLEKLNAFNDAHPYNA